ncbi:methyl-accepting chemotaxis protein [Paraburkholderia lycopersici]|uniref:Methyl-accepting chemotaxis protein n=1 Tax=Paraburkholderia lycopersici TaxID=416944 RepID=A0A1G6IPQ2_9BURK|nr:methyl-accepting chemotaxis protein [Paraburkholderia lycopersici]SDC08411.1 Methyl-accepting chemotaxis protein [Paraburkholderia lycopersici]
MAKNLSIRTCLTLMVVVFAITLITGAAVGLLSLRESNEALRQTYTVDTPAVANLESSTGQLLRLRLALATYASLDDLHDADGAQGVLRRSDQYMKISDDKLAAFLATLDGDKGDLVRDMQAKRDVFLHDGVAPALAALKSDNRDAFLKLQAYQLPKLYGAYEKAMIAVEKVQLDRGAQRYDDAQKRFSFVTTAVAIGLVFTLLVALMMRLWLVRAIVHPADAAVEHFERIAAGDLGAHIVADSSNEMGRLMRALSKMQASLIATVRDVRGGVDTINTGVSEIAAGNSDLSQRTEQQAASLEETVASIEELTTTLSQTADNAKVASSLAANASSLASQGGELTDEVSSAMDGIVGDSRRIGEIVGMIEGIAFQTNILALNAAVESARAGEHGRGFAVVAGEVRSLSQRSAAAAREIKDVIQDSGARVGNGAEIVKRSGDAMKQIVESITRVSAIMHDIEMASSEQRVGIEQINLAISQMDQVTQQNAALVEQAAAAAVSLNEQAQRLSSAVEVFRLDGADLAARPVAAPEQTAAVQAT